jgi:hypothetical protein
MLPPPGAAQVSETFLIPGADLSQLVFETGAWCRYIVVDEALGQVDSTEVYIGIPESEVTDEGPAYWVELASKPLRAHPGEGQVVRLLVLKSITEIAEGDSLGRYVRKLYIKKGTRPLEEKDPDSYEDLTLIVPTSEALWESSPEANVVTKGGAFNCTKKTRRVESNQEIPTGKIKLIKKSRDDYTVWFCDDVPVFRLVKCVIERSRETDTVPRMTGIPVSGPRYSRSEAELTEFGDDAESILTRDGSTR